MLSQIVRHRLRPTPTLNVLFTYAASIATGRFLPVKEDVATCVHGVGLPGQHHRNVH